MSRTRRTWGVLRRLVPLVVAFLRDRRRWIFFGASRQLPFEVHQRRARRIVTAIGELGPTYIKLAQVFSSRSDGTSASRTPRMPCSGLKSATSCTPGAR